MSLLDFLKNLRVGSGVGWDVKLPVFRWFLENADEAYAAMGHMQVILAETDEATEREAILNLVRVLHPVYWRNPFTGDPDAAFALAPGAGHAEVMALLPQAPDGSKLKAIIAFLMEYSDEAVQIFLTLLALFGRKSVK